MTSRLQQAYVQFALDIDPNCVMTLGEGPGVNVITAQERITHFLNVVQRQGLGRNWHNKPSDQRLRAVGFREHHLTNPHWHLAVHAPGKLLIAIHETKTLWPKLCYRGHVWADIIDCPEGYSRYITKNHYMPATADNPFVYSPGC